MKKKSKKKMAGGGSIYELRSWMYLHKDSDGRVTNAFLSGLETFMHQAGCTPITQESGKMFCPCRKCKNSKFARSETVWKHLVNRGFTPQYYIWYQHGEGYGGNEASSSNNNFEDGHHSEEPNHLHNEYNYHQDQEQMVDHDRVQDMISDAFLETTTTIADGTGNVEEPNLDAKRFYEMLDAANQPIYTGCREGLSKLSLAARMMNIKTDHNLPENCMDAWAELFKEYLPEDNVSAESYYEIQKLVYSLGLPSEMIDVCIDNCMIYWKEDDKLEECRFCKKPRFKPQGRGRNRVPYQRMWYLPITDRLKRLYQSERTAASMRWHAEHVQRDGEVAHPSDARAWKHFNKVHADFATNIRNVYLGLCTDGFSPFGMSGRQYSLWPVILTPYNLPPDMCMEQEFLFLTILIPGPKHPKRSLDVFLQPLIEELKQLWSEGVRTYDCSLKNNFTMRAVLLWTISDFPAYGMLSGWTTHGRLSCPYCLGSTDAFQLKNGRKSCWFDCHRRFLPLAHPYRRNKTLFRHKKIVRDGPPPYLTGQQIEADIDYYGAQETVKVGGNWHVPGNMPDGYGVSHNWHKKSIFWELPYWKDLLLRHNLDVMHIEKNFFENIMNTLLNVPGKTKDNKKSRMDLPDICSRSELHIKSNGNVPVPIFRLSSEAKTTLFDWVASEVKFPDGYVSNLSRCVERGQKFSGMKSHDCHVFMQRLLPFAFAELLPANVHEALAGNYNFIIYIHML